MRTIKYYSEVGSYRGCVKLRGRWHSVKNLNYVDKSDWVRLSGPPTKAMWDAMKENPLDARVIVNSIP